MIHGLLPARILCDLQLNLFHRMEDGGVVPPTKGPANLRQGGLGQLSAEKHGDLPRVEDRPLALGAANFMQLQLEIPRHPLLDLFQRDT